MIASAIGFAAVFVLVLLRLPIAFAMGLVGMIGLVYETSYRASISMVSRLIIDTSQDYGLSVIPLFILMGLFVNKGGISRELYQVSNAFLGHFQGRSGHGHHRRLRGLCGDLWLFLGHGGDHVQGRHARDAQIRLC